MHDWLPQVDHSRFSHKTSVDRHSSLGWENLHSNSHWVHFSLGDSQEGSNGLSQGGWLIVTSSHQLSDWNDYTSHGSNPNIGSRWNTKSMRLGNLKNRARISKDIEQLFLEHDLKDRQEYMNYKF